MSIKLGIVMDPIGQINFKKDTSLALLNAAQERGCELFYMEQADLSIQAGRAYGRMAPIKVAMNQDHWFDLGEYQDRLLADLDIILMRKDPPFDGEFIYSTYILERAEQEGVLIANKPQSLRDCNEKVFATAFADLMSPTIVTRRSDLLKQFHREHGDVIFKPLDGMGGSSIFRLRQDDPNVSVIIETLTNHGQQQIMAQRFIPDITAGDKRILMIDGEPVPYCLARIPADGETRGNLAAGGRGVTQPLSDSDRAIAEKIGPELKARGLYFVGLDIIGNYVTEINVTSPTCVREISRDSGIDVATQLIDALLAKR
ncbi:MAG: glutathione synthase [Thalassolituus sp.]|jgi:glutathione synthase|uniref:glutathione synthase n=1 Tax=hydrothermal vent metagenome TaxID=652676 RepID=A0A160TF80_9ZZZZ|nr:glutathione synthase [Thalassolituus oleivorans]PCI50355.1 MAG: glutathione synthase [Oceanospirillales bacterium]PHQ88153.1 MAG: glutathione synthase [Thalassobium sp.]AHK14778.1 glutathione synthetase [Thalassolituus oleivorans R6-15]MBQ0728288.1 glutathione synthase [Thalassolituus oleivorans]MDF1639453.1 glutathione synthase [Thalassolituus oleivorans]